MFFFFSDPAVSSSTFLGENGEFDYCRFTQSTAQLLADCFGLQGLISAVLDLCQAELSTRIYALPGCPALVAGPAHTVGSIGGGPDQLFFFCSCLLSRLKANDFAMRLK